MMMAGEMIMMMIGIRIIFNDDRLTEIRLTEIH